jgi:hypothetical protein
MRERVRPARKAIPLPVPPETFSVWVLEEDCCEGDHETLSFW